MLNYHRVWTIHDNPPSIDHVPWKNSVESHGIAGIATLFPLGQTPCRNHGFVGDCNAYFKGQKAIGCVNKSVRGNGITNVINQSPYMKIGVPICQLIMSDLIGSSPTAAVRAAKMNKPSWVLWWRTPRCSAAVRQESVWYGESPCLIGKSANIHGPCSRENYDNLLEGNPKKCLVYGRLW